MKKTFFVAVAVAFALAGCVTAQEQHAEARSKLSGATAPSTYAFEDADWGIASTENLQKEKLHSSTPTTVPGVKTIKTAELLPLLKSVNPPIVLDTLGGSGHATLPGAYWLRGAGTGERFDDAIQSRLETKVAALANGAKAQSIVTLCLSAECWLSYNTALRLKRMGYTNVQWYRGGVDAWKAAGLPMAPAVLEQW
ncbi:rhodanese-like domain-containing protein [Shumkonia mesophila]|uniref:rhodanese-like domain-containing protein n=1 Tax=Shumkonia mesophila TaxID=2838854 RepID=UPI0029342446|nr:rhodanese-like domain-containing protein [Shumkonia mesophila]